MLAPSVLNTLLLLSTAPLLGADIFPTICQNGYRRVDDLCYKHYPEKKTYDDAQQTCVSEGATLIEPRSQADLNLLDSEWGHLEKMYEWTEWVPLQLIYVAVPDSITTCSYTSVHKYLNTNSAVENWAYEVIFWLECQSCV